MRKVLFIGLVCSGLVLAANSCSGSSESTSKTESNEVTVDEPEKPVKKVRYASLELDRLSTTLGITVGQDDDVELFREVATWVGTPYKSAGADKNGADCSGFVNAVYDKVYNISLPRQTSKIYERSSRIDLEDAKTGDLVFFRTDGKTNQTPNYMGIYLKENRFVVMSSKGLKFENMSSSYYKKNFVCAATIEELCRIRHDNVFSNLLGKRTSLEIIHDVKISRFKSAYFDIAI